jgi:hypothetical protein
MSQHDYVIGNDTSANVRADINTALLAIASNNSGASAPATTYANQWWYDTATDTLKFRSEANDAFIVVAKFDQANSKFLVVKESALNGSAIIPASTQANRDASPAAGYFRFNTDLGKFEGHNGTTWGSVGGGATGGGADDIFMENGQTVTTNYTITTNKNALTAGPITVNSGVTVTIPSGSVWTIV